MNFQALYSKKVLKHFRNPKNMGEMKNPDGVATVGNPVCGDIMRLYIKIATRNTQHLPCRQAGATRKRPSSAKASEGKEGYIKDIKFQTLGCAAAIATSSILTTMVKGKTLAEAEKVTNKAVAEALGGLPQAKIHCSVLVADALKKAIENYRSR